MRKTLELLKFIAKRYLEKAPFLYIAIAYGFNKFRNRPTNRIVTKESTVCIEGFPRCANSFASSAFPKYTGKDVAIATHLHSAAQIIEAVKLGVPTIVLIRKPDDCILSLRALILEDAEKKNETIGLLPVSYDLKWYISFYESIMSIKNRFVIAKFDDVVRDFNQIMKAYNEKYETAYPTDLDHDSLQKSIFDASAFHLSPSPRRNEFKQAVKSEYYDPAVKGLVEKANQVYESFIS